MKLSAIIHLLTSFSLVLLAGPKPAQATHIPTHPPAGISATHLDLNPPGLVTPLGPGGVVLSPFLDLDPNPLGLYHWETEIWNLGIVPAFFTAGWFAPGPGFPVIRKVGLAPGWGIYAHLHVNDLFFFPFPEVGPRLHFAFNFTPYLLGFDASVRELLPPFVGTEPGLEGYEFLGTGDCPECIFEETTGPVDFGLGGVVPEPSSIILMSSGLLGLVGYGWRKRKA